MYAIYVQKLHGEFIKNKKKSAKKKQQYIPFIIQTKLTINKHNENTYKIK